ncbi:MAG TPA: asparagine synthase C-terminal domain-containing protein, partial [Candidatus Polarisedimenticolia bacterium]|nr:asparagine synthase C-terminal domain-containing protein [Candidatus Polarisedimenticolia bacterium]
DAVERRMPASGPVVTFLSGGLDSSVVAALASRELGRRVTAFSIGFPQARLDESEHARRVAALVGAEHRLIMLESVEPDLVVRVIRQLDEPMADPATIPTYVLAREASAVGDVVMTGDGADALLAGDHWFRRLQRLDAMERWPRPLRETVCLFAALGGPSRRKKAVALAALLDLAPAERYLRIREKWTLEERLDAYDGGFRSGLDTAATAATYVHAPVDWREGESVDAAIRLDTIHGLPEALLMKADKMGNAHGVESRSPFLDRRLAEWAARLDIGLLIRGGASKYLLKKTAESLLPRDLIYRRKHGFQIPLAAWLKGCLRDLTGAAFSPDLIRRQGIFDPAAIARLESRFRAGEAAPALAGQVWQIVAFQTWWTDVFGGR